MLVRRLMVAVSILLACTALLAAPAQAATAPAWNTQVADLDYLVNTLSYSSFGTLHAAPPAMYGYLDWSTDGCSAGPIAGSPYHFDQACWRHDFSWRNLKRITATTGHVEWNERNKYVADQRFYNDMKTRCLVYNVFVRPTCDAAAYTYYKAVRVITPYASNQTLHDNPTHFSYN